MSEATIDVLVVGAGFAGIGMAIQLKRSGRDSFVIIERASEVGGTWRDNTYPGVGCDIPSHLYSFSFRLNPNWSTIYASGVEIKNYLSHAVAEENLSPHLKLQTELLESRWDEDDQLWHVETNRGNFLVRNLVLACGRLTKPRLPPVSGAMEFEGEWFHSAQWRHDVSLRGKRVGIVGSGASAIQIVPKIVDQVSELVVLQRSAPYVVPRNNEPYKSEQISRFSRDQNAMLSLRDEQFWRQEEIFTQRLVDSETRDVAKEIALNHLRQEISNEKLRAQLTPDYEYGCKRVLLSDEYYAAMSRSNVTLVPSALKSVDGNKVRTVDGFSTELDVLIYATGFFTLKQPFATRIHGRGGVKLSEYWRDGMRAFASTLVAGYPNLFVLDGPNSALGHNSAVFMIESQIELVMRWLELESSKTLEISRQAEDEYVAEIEQRGRQTVWMGGGCTNWYVDRKADRLTVLWPNNAIAFQTMLRSIDLIAVAEDSSKTDIVAAAINPTPNR